MGGVGLLTTRRAADAIGVGVSTLQAWAVAGTVTPAWRTPGGHARWDLEDLRRQLAKGGLLSDPNAPILQPIVAVIAVSGDRVLVTRRHDETPPLGFLTGKIN